MWRAFTVIFLLLMLQEVKSSVTVAGKGVWLMVGVVNYTDQRIGGAGSSLFSSGVDLVYSRNYLYGQFIFHYRTTMQNATWTFVSS